MTTYQDPPLQSRRAARQNERADAEQQQYPGAASAPMPPTPDPSVNAYATPESLLYATQGTAAPDYGMPSEYDAQGLRGRRAVETPDETAARNEAGYRVRDFSPEARRAALQNWSQPGAIDGNLTYQTQQRPPAPVQSPPPPPEAWTPPPAAPVASEAPVAQGFTVPEHTLTRRELRALREAQGLPPETGPVAPVAAAQSAPAPAPIPLVEPEPWNAGQPQAAPVYEAPQQAWQTAQPEYRTVSHYADPASPAETAAVSDQSAFEALFGNQEQPQTAPEAEFPTRFAADIGATTPPQYATTPPQFATTPPEVVPVAPVAQAAPLAAAASVTPVAPVTAEPQYEEPVATGERPVGHWSRQAELDDEAQFATNAHSREVGIGILTTNALVLPEIPHHDFTRTLTSTGDIMVTGSIDLPRSLSSTGAMPTQLDESDIDHLLDPGDRQVASTDSQPVRAVKAVSTHTSSRGIINAAPPKRGNKMLTVLIASACAMLVVVVGLAIVIVSSNVLG